MFSVYAIKSKIRNYIYVGLTADVLRRLAEHNEGHERTTRPYRPFELIYTEQFETRPEARVSEKFLKSGVGKEFLKALYQGSSLPAGRQVPPSALLKAVSTIC